MKEYFFIFSIFLFLIFQPVSVNADTKKQAEKGSVGASVSANLTEQLRKGKEKVQVLCSACHGLDGVAASGGNSVIVPNLTAQHKDYQIAKKNLFYLKPVSNNLSQTTILKLRISTRIFIYNSQYKCC